MDQFGLSDRQRTAIFRVLEKGRLTSADYQKLTGASRQTAARDLEELVVKGVLLRQGRGRGVNYLLAQKWLTIDPNGS